MKRVRADVADRGLQWVGLLHTTRVAPGVGCGAAATGAETSASAAEAAATCRAARVLHEALVEGLLEWIGYLAVVDLVVVAVRVTVQLELALRAALHRLRAAFGNRAAHRAANAIVRPRALLAVTALHLRRRAASFAPAIAARIARLAVAGREPANGAHIVLVEVGPDAALEAARQHHGAITDSNQPADRQPDGVEQLAHLAVAPFRDDDPIPVVDALAAAVLDGSKARFLPIDVDPFEQIGLVVGHQGAEHAHRIFTFDAEARVHQLIGQFTGVGEQQQTFRVDVEPADRLPLALLQARQAPVHGGPVLRIVVRDNLAHWLVVSNDARRRRHDSVFDRLATDLDAVAEGHPLSDVSDLVIDRHPPVKNHLLQISARADTGLRQHLVQLRRLGLGLQDALRGGGRRF